MRRQRIEFLLTVKLPSLECQARKLCIYLSCKIIKKKHI